MAIFYVLNFVSIFWSRGISSLEIKKINKRLKDKAFSKRQRKSIE